MDEKYLAVIGDIIASRKETNRAAVQKKLKYVLKKVNETFSGVIAADFLVTLGDEFQGLLFCGAETKAIFIAAYIMDRMYPVRLRISVGFGGMDTAVDRAAAIGADGEAFHRARQGMDSLRKAEREPRSVIRVSTGDKKTDLAVNTVLDLCSVLRNDWTKRQTEIAILFTESFIFNKKLTQRQIAEKAGITQGTVNISLKASGALSFARGLAAAQELLKPYEKLHNGSG